MKSLSHLREMFELLTRGRHLSPEDEPLFSALVADYEAYAGYFAPLGFKLVRHEREFFYFEPDHPEKMPETLPRIAVFAFVLVDHAANQGVAVEEYLLGRSFLIGNLPHFTLERYAALLRQVSVHDESDLVRVLDHMERLGWLKWLGTDEFRLLRPFHRVFDTCLRLSPASEAAPAPGSGPTAVDPLPQPDSP